MFTTVRSPDLHKTRTLRSSGRLHYLRFGRCGRSEGNRKFGARQRLSENNGPDCLELSAGRRPVFAFSGSTEKSMKTLGWIIGVFLIALGSAATAAPATGAAPVWTEGTHYFLIKPPRPMSPTPGKVEVTEVFSYACPACNLFQPTMHKLKQSLPANTVVDYLPASFNPGEDWPMFQLAYCTAQVLGIADQTHDAMFDAVWGTGELAILDPSGGRIKERLPTIEDAARFYNKK